jgi:hypothetical protein
VRTKPDVVWHEGVLIVSGSYTAVCQECGGYGCTCPRCHGTGGVLGTVGKDDGAFPVDYFANMRPDRHEPDYEEEPDADD